MQVYYYQRQNISEVEIYQKMCLTTLEAYIILYTYIICIFMPLRALKK